MGCLPFLPDTGERLFVDTYYLEAGPLCMFAEVPLLTVVVLIGGRDPAVQNNPSPSILDPVSLYQLNPFGFHTL